MAPFRRNTLFSLHKLHDKQHISGRDFHELTWAYTFLRHLEHRLQLRPWTASAPSAGVGSGIGSHPACHGSAHAGTSAHR
jgi:hypothetical protein